MVKITKGPEPYILSSNKLQWKQELLDFIRDNAGQKVPEGIYSRYNNNETKELLKKECNNKCMYCESVVSHIAHEHIEHYKPKARNKYPELTYEWENLGLSCPICNMNKSDTFDDTCSFINPYLDDPEEHFVALGNMMYNKPGNKRAEITKRIIDLNRADLIQMRNERLLSIERLINRFHDETNLILKEAIRVEIEDEIQSDKPYSMCTSSLYINLM